MTNKYTINDLEKLIAEIRVATGYTQSEIEKAANYNPGYISQVKTKGKVPDKLMQTLSTHFKKQLGSNLQVEYNSLLEQISILRASQEVQLGMITEILAHLRNTSAIALSEEAVALINTKLQKLKGHLE